MDIQKLNCLKPDNAATPKYNPYSGKSCVQVYYVNNNKVIIVGVAGASEKKSVKRQQTVIK